MAFGDALQKRVEELQKRQPMISKRLAEIAEGATDRAVEVAVAHTPPNTFEDGEIRGVNMITGELAQHWETDSRTVPVQIGTRFQTTLKNNKRYASYVNDGHIMDKHLVRGLYVDKNGVLSKDPERDVYLMVGTKTKYVPGLYMKEKAIDKYKEIAEAELKKLGGEMFK